MEFKKQLRQVKKAIEYHRIHRGVKIIQEQPKEASSCSCQDKNGELKTLYPTQAKAVAQANEVWRFKGIRLKSYPCPDTLGWHLSHS